MGKYSDPTMPGPSNGNLQGDVGGMPDRGTSSGSVGMGAPYGADIGENATNRIKGIGRSTNSDPMFETCPPGGGDFSSSGHSSPSSGTGMGSAADSDGINDERPHDQRK